MNLGISLNLPNLQELNLIFKMTASIYLLDFCIVITFLFHVIFLSYLHSTMMQALIKLFILCILLMRKRSGSVLSA